MSKRYGRNQKRHHRERIEKLEAALLETAGLLTFHANRADRLQGRIEDWARRIRRVCGDHHPFNEHAAEITVRRLEPFVRFGEHRRFTLQEAMSFELERASATYIEAVSHKLEVDQAAPSGVPRVVVKLKAGNGEQSAYAMDSDFLQQGRRDPEFIRYVEQQVGERLAECMG